MTTVEKIHKEFREALDSSKIEVGNVQMLEDVNSSMERLSSLGLERTKTYQKFSKQYDGQAGVLRTNKLITELQNLETRYPAYRLIGLKKVVEISEKYGLFVSGIKNFIGTIPAKNLSEIERHREIMRLDGKGDCAFYSNNQVLNHLHKNNLQGANTPTDFIAAPKQDFCEGLTPVGRILYDDIKRPKMVLGFNIDISFPAPDPIVLCPMKVNNAIIFQIVTAWGPEADDDYIRKSVITNLESSN